MNRTYTATKGGVSGWPEFTPDELGEILGVKLPIYFETPGNRRPRVHKVEIQEDKIRLYAYNS